MAWYVADIFLKGSHLSNKSVMPLWEEKMILVQASSEEEARHEAEKIGRNSECEYDVRDGKLGHPPGRLKWEFQTVERVIFIEEQEIKSGMEIFSRFLRDSEARSLLTPFSETKAK
jgi:hypothetical protein